MLLINLFIAANNTLICFEYTFNFSLTQDFDLVLQEDPQHTNL